MKTILRNYGIRMTAEQKQIGRSQMIDMTLVRGTGRTPGNPRDLFVQSGPRGILLNWRGPAFSGDVAGYRIYKDDETKLFAEVKDPLTTQHFVETTAGTTPPSVNLFVSSVNKLGQESKKVQIQGAAITETGAPTMPSTPNSYNTTFNPISRNPRVRDANEQI